MKLIKNMPNWLAHSIFVNSNTEVFELNGADINLFFVLIFLTSKSYDDKKNTTKKTTFSYSIAKMQKANKKSSEINSSLKKLDGLEIISNIFESYGDKQLVKYKPFIIKLVKDKNNPNKIVKAKITVDETFIKTFTNPKDNFTLSYEYFSNFSNPQAKMLYIILFDHLGKVNIGTAKNRNIPIEALAPLMNKSFDCSLEQLKRVVKSSVEYINEHTDIEVINNGYGYDDSDMDEEILKCKFEIRRVKPYPFYEKIPQIKDYIEEVEVSKDTENDATDTENNNEINVDKLIEEIIDYEVEKYERDTNEMIKSIKGFRKHKEKDIKLEENKDYILPIYYFIQKSKKLLGEDKSIDYTQPNILSFTVDYINFYNINNRYLLYNNKKQVTKSIKETYTFILELQKEGEVKATVYNLADPDYKISKL